MDKGRRCKFSAAPCLFSLAHLFILLLTVCPLAQAAATDSTTPTTKSTAPVTDSNSPTEEVLAPQEAVTGPPPPLPSQTNTNDIPPPASGPSGPLPKTKSTSETEPEKIEAEVGHIEDASSAGKAPSDAAVTEVDTGAPESDSEKTVVNEQSGALPIGPVTKGTDSRFQTDSFDEQPEGGPEAAPEAAPETSPEVSPEAAQEAEPEAEPEAAPEIAPKVAPEAAPKVAPEAVPEATPEATLDVAPEAAPETPPEIVPKVASEDAPKVAPEAQPKAAPEAVPEATPEATSKAAPEASSEVAPEAAPGTPPEIAPEAAPEATSEVAPEADPEAEPKAAHEVAPEVMPEIPPEIPSNSTPYELLEVVSKVPFNYRLDEASCSELSPAVLNATVELIINSFNSPNCSSIVGLKLHPATNKRIRGQVVETSLVALDVARFFPVSAHKLIKCGVQQSNDGSDEKGKGLRFRLIIEQKAGDHIVISRWRHYPRLHQDDIPLEVVSSVRGARSKASSKCQKFKTNSGEFHLNLLAFKSTLEFEIELTKDPVSDSYAVPSRSSGKILMTDFRVNELYLTHGLYLDRYRPFSSSPRSAAGGGDHQLASLISAPTVQVLHDHNNHHRRNNWLLDMYGNWLRHEYKKQLGRLLGKPLAEQLNSCLVL